METGLPRPIGPMPNIGETRPVMDRTGVPGPPPAEIMPLPQNSFQRGDMTSELLRDPRPLSTDTYERTRREEKKADAPKEPREREEAAYQLELGERKARMKNEALETILAYERLGRSPRLIPAARLLRPIPGETAPVSAPEPAPDPEGEAGSARPDTPESRPPEEMDKPPLPGEGAPARGFAPPKAALKTEPALPRREAPPWARPPEAVSETPSGPAGLELPPKLSAQAPEAAAYEPPPADSEPYPARPAPAAPEGGERAAVAVALSAPELERRPRGPQKATGVDPDASPERKTGLPAGGREAPIEAAGRAARAAGSPAAGETRSAPENLRKLSQPPYWLYLFGGDVPRYADEEEARALPSRRARRAQPDWTGEHLTMAEAARLAAVLHNVYFGGDGSFERDEPWYRPFVRYALNHGILRAGEFEEPEAPVTRGYLAEILARCVPDAALPPINPLVTIPDVREGEGWGESALKMVRAGVFAPVGPLGLFDPERLVTRREASVYVGRIITPSDRRRL